MELTTAQTVSRMKKQITSECALIETVLMIANKQGEDVPFMLNSAQSKLSKVLTGRDFVPKARQEGVSALILALFTIRCLYKRNTRAVVISHDAESTERLFKRVKYYIDNLRGMSAVTELASKREFTFPKTNSMFYIGTAGARKFGRGDTITDLHCSEVAFWDDPKELTAGLFQAVPRSGFICIESTGNGHNWYYRRIQSTLIGKGRYSTHFLDWLSFNEYDLMLEDSEKEEVLASLDPDYDEPVLMKEMGLTVGQIQFRREKLDEMDFDVDLFKQEYPMTLEECFRTSGVSLFHKVNYVPTKAWEKVDRFTHTLQHHPRKSGLYGMGVDVGGGVKQDESVIEIVDLIENEQVGEWRSDTVPPDALAHYIKQLGEQYNNAYVSVESNNHGLTTLSELCKIYPSYLIHKRESSSDNNDVMLMKLGVLQTKRVKPLSLGILRRWLVEGLIIHSEVLDAQFATFVEHEGGRLEAQVGEKDDTVMAMAALAYVKDLALLRIGGGDDGKVVSINAKRANDPFLVDNIIKECRKNYGGAFPIKCQARSSVE